MRFAGVIAVSLLSAVASFPNDDLQPPPKAPLPELMLKARTVMVTSEAGSLVHDEAYKSLQKWGRFKLTTEKSQADLMIVLQSNESTEPPQVRGVLLPYPSPRPNPYPPPITRLSLWLIIADSRAHRALWTDRQFASWPVGEQNREKYTIRSVDSLFKRLRKRFPK